MGGAEPVLRAPDEDGDAPWLCRPLSVARAPGPRPPAPCSGPAEQRGSDSAALRVTLSGRT